MKKTIFSAFLLFASAVFVLGAQEAEKKPAAAAEPPRGFRGIVLGDSPEKVKETLKADSFFFYRGEPDVSFLPKQPETVIECERNIYLKRALFIFREERLVTIILNVNPLKMDYYTLFRTLSKKYGPPKLLDPSQAVWETDRTRLALEKPLTVKYVDPEVVGKNRNAAGTKPPPEDLSRGAFLELF